MTIKHFQDATHRRCSTCDETKPLDDFVLQQIKLGSGNMSRPYRRPECAACRKLINAERFQRNKEQYRPARTAWYVNNLEKAAWIRTRTRARREGATEFLSLDEWRELTSATTCHWCNCTLHPSFTQIDHVRPLAWGGQHTRDNLVLSCANCNVRRDWETKIRHQKGR